MKNKSGRTFTVSLKPYWPSDKMEEFIDSLTGTAVAYGITHNKDTDNNGNLVEAHTHIMLEYDTPRKVSTVANLFNVEPNFIEIVRNKKGMLRYLTHMDTPDKHRYDFTEVYTNNSITYEQAILGSGMSDKDIADYIIKGKGLDLIGLVPIGKLRTIQGFVHFDQSNAILKETRETNRKLEQVLDIVDNVKQITTAFIGGVEHSVHDLTAGMQAIAKELNRSNNIIQYRRRK